MIKKLTKRGLAKHVPYRGVSLTAAGERVALEVICHHRLLEAAYKLAHDRVRVAMQLRRRIPAEPSPDRRPRSLPLK